MTAAENNSAGYSGKVGPLQRWAFENRPGENRWMGLVRCWFRIVFIMIHEYAAAAISLRAAALTYSIVLSLVPLLAMSTAILKGMGGGDQLKIAAYRLIEQLEPGGGQPAENVPPPPANPESPVPASQETPPTPEESPADPSVAVPSAQNGSNPPELTRDLRRAVDTIFAYVDRTNFAAIGAFGIAGLLLTVVLVMSTIEDAMNAIWHTDQRRSPLRKVMDYLALLLLLPVSINAAIAGEAALASPEIMARIKAVIPSLWVVGTLLKLLPFLFVLLSLTVMYMFFPSVRVTTSAALTGAFFAGVFWFLGQKLYLVLQIGVARSNAIYGSFATVPLFLIWVQLGWTFILLGASLAYAVQNRNQYRLPGETLSPQHRLQLAFDVLQVIYANFARKKRTTLAQLVAALNGEKPGEILATADALVQDGFLVRTESGRPIFLPLAPAEALEAGEVIRRLFGDEAISTPGGRLAGTAVRAAAGAIPRSAFPVVSPPPDSSAGSPDKETDNEKTL